MTKKAVPLTHAGGRHILHRVIFLVMLCMLAAGTPEHVWCPAVRSLRNASSFT